MITVDIYKKLKYFDLNIKFEVNNEVLVIQGPSGSGKTTTIDCIAGIKQPDKGHIIINDRLVFSTDERINIPIKDRNIGYVFQDYVLFPHMTVQQNIMYGIKSRGIREHNYVDYLIEAFNLKHLKNRYPSQISGGEKQRVALVRALSTRPELLLLDEPFSALDNNTRNKVYEEFLDFKKNSNMSIILITHNDQEAVLLGDRIIRINDGIIV
jgi:molybdate transport system ATP-binding protein